MKQKLIFIPLLILFIFVGAFGCGGSSNPEKKILGDWEQEHDNKATQVNVYRINDDMTAKRIMYSAAKGESYDTLDWKTATSWTWEYNKGSKKYILTETGQTEGKITLYFDEDGNLISGAGSKYIKKA